MTDTPHPVDVHVGSRIRERRRELKLSQNALADRVGYTFQQVQKYEKGTNRVSASKLWEIAAVLAVPVTYFYDELPVTSTGQVVELTPKAAKLRHVMQRGDVHQLARLVADLPSMAQHMVIEAGIAAARAALQAQDFEQQRRTG